MKRAAVSTFSATIHVVVAGVDQASGGWLESLSAPQRDAKRLADALTDISGCAIPEHQVACLVGPAATRSAVVGALAAAVARARPEDSIYFYFAGHGLADALTFYLCSVDAEKDRLSETAITSLDLETVLDSTACRGVFVILDCCEGAAFAEFAPLMFRRLRRGEYRILLSSVRAGQRSWERTERGGTFFSNALIGIVEGAIHVGTTPGATYFSDLVSAIDSQIAESLYSFPDHPRQDMVFVGTYIRDPLIFVHKALSLAQVQLATARYSPSYVRRIFTKASILVVAILFFSGTTAYGLLNATQYVVDEGERLVVFQGNPHFNLPGFPKSIWSLPYGTERLSGTAISRDLTIIAPVGEPVYPLLENRLRPDMRILTLLESGNSTEARVAAMELIGNSAAPFEQRLNSHLVFASVAQAQDAGILSDWLNHERTEIRQAALRALMRVAPSTGFTYANNLDDSEAADFHIDVLKLLNGECTSEVTRYLEKRFDARSSHPTNEQIFDAASRLQCRLSTNSLLRAVDRPQMFGDRHAAGYVRLIRIDNEFAGALAGRLRGGSPDILRQGTLLGTLLELPIAPCIPEYQKALSAPLLHVRVTAMVAMASHCHNMSLRLSWRPNSKAVTVDLVKGARAISSIVLSLADDQARNSLVLLTRLPDGRLPPAELRAIARELLESAKDDHLRAALVNTLVRLNDNAGLPADLLDSNNIEVRTAVVEYRRAMTDPKLRTQLLSRIGGRDEFYVGLLGRMSLDDITEKKLVMLLDGTPAERRQSACVLAMQADRDVVLRLLLNPDSRVRQEAVGCAPFNVHAKSIGEALPRALNGFPIEGYQFFKDQMGIRLALEEQLAEMPVSLQEWRLSIVDLTPGGFGRLGRGMRYWVDERKYQQRILAAASNKTQPSRNEAMSDSQQAFRQ